MTSKREFIDRMVKNTGLMREDATSMIDVVFAQIRSALLEGHEVRVTDVGTIKPTYKPAHRRASNLPNLKDSEIRVPARVGLRFKIYPGMAEDIKVLLPQMQAEDDS